MEAADIALTQEHNIKSNPFNNFHQPKITFQARSHSIANSGFKNRFFGF
jgi:hypothetical protein